MRTVDLYVLIFDWKKPSRESVEKPRTATNNGNRADLISAMSTLLFQSILKGLCDEISPLIRSVMFSFVPLVIQITEKETTDNQ